MADVLLNVSDGLDVIIGLPFDRAAGLFDSASGLFDSFGAEAFIAGYSVVILVSAGLDVGTSEGSESLLLSQVSLGLGLTFSEASTNFLSSSVSDSLSVSCSASSSNLSTILVAITLDAEISGMTSANFISTTVTDTLSVGSSNGALFFRDIALAEPDIYRDITR